MDNLCKNSQPFLAFTNLATNRKELSFMAIYKNQCLILTEWMSILFNIACM